MTLSIALIALRCRVVVRIVKEAATRLSLRSIRLGEYKLKPTQTRVRNDVVVGGRGLCLQLLFGAVCLMLCVLFC